MYLTEFMLRDILPGVCLVGYGAALLVGGFGGQIAGVADGHAGTLEGILGL